MDRIAKLETLEFKIRSHIRYLRDKLARSRVNPDCVTVPDWVIEARIYRALGTLVRVCNALVRASTRVLRGCVDTLDRLSRPIRRGLWRAAIGSRKPLRKFAMG